jgi:hypothetical protein
MKQKALQGQNMPTHGVALGNGETTKYIALKGHTMLTSRVSGMKEGCDENKSPERAEY